MSNGYPTKPVGKRVAVVTDSTSYVPQRLYESLGVRTVSLYVGWDGDLRPECSYCDLPAFYERLRREPEVPRTSQPSIGDFLDVYRPLVEAGTDVASVHLAAGLSGTCESAREAAALLAQEGHDARVEVIDAETGAGGLGLVVIAAAECADGGADLDTVARCARDTRAGLDIFFYLDTLEFLRRGGRIGAARAMLGTALQLKPILTFGTEIAPVARVRTRARGLDRLAEYLRELRARGANRWIVQQIQCEEPSRRMLEQGREIFNSEPEFVSEVGPVLGAHLGAGMLVGGF
ncbi:MAG TPA: DegV family protein [Solirubrobacteraceae bacterium]|nr:DegV family protein [Solirubrobacteraceae bacterium]